MLDFRFFCNLEQFNISFDILIVYIQWINLMSCISACKSEYRIPSKIMLVKSTAILYQISHISCSSFSYRKHPIMQGFFVFILFFYTGVVLYTCKIITGYHLRHANQTHTICRVTIVLKKITTELEENIRFSYIKCNAVK